MCCDSDTHFISNFLNGSVNPIDDIERLSHIIINFNRADIFRLLVSRGVNLRSSFGSDNSDTAFTYVVKKGDTISKEIVQIIIDNEPSLLYLDTYGFILDWLVVGNYNRIFEMLVNDEIHGPKLLSDPRSNHLLHTAAAKGNKKVVELLYEKGFNINLFNGYGDTPLKYAMLNDNRRVARYLADRGAIFPNGSYKYDSRYVKYKTRKIWKHQTFIRQKYFDNWVQKMRRMGYFTIIPLDITKLVVKYL